MAFHKIAKKLAVCRSFTKGMSNSKHFAGRKRSFEAKTNCLRAAVKKIIDLIFVSKAL